jgi:hypothetical protein
MPGVLSGDADSVEIITLEECVDPDFVRHTKLLGEARRDIGPIFGNVRVFGDRNELDIGALQERL